MTRYRSQIANRDPAFQKHAAELFSLLIRPALSQVSTSSSLIIVPDGVLWDLPFQALRSENQRYLIEEKTIFYAPSLTALREMAKAGVDLPVNRVPLICGPGNPDRWVR